MAEAIGTTGDITRTGVTTVNVTDTVIPTDTVITGNAAKAAHPEAVQWKDALPLFSYPPCVPYGPALRLHAFQSDSRRKAIYFFYRSPVSVECGPVLARIMDDVHP